MKGMRIGNVRRSIYCCNFFHVPHYSDSPTHKLKTNTYMQISCNLNGTIATMWSTAEFATIGLDFRTVSSMSQRIFETVSSDCDPYGLDSSLVWFNAFIIFNIDSSTWTGYGSEWVGGSVSNRDWFRKQNFSRFNFGASVLVDAPYHCTVLNTV